MDSKKILEEIRDSLDEVIRQQGGKGKLLWQSLLQMHPVDIADLLAELSKDDARALFIALPREKRLEIFDEMSEKMKVFVLSLMPEGDQVDALETLSTDELTDLFDEFSDAELKKYLNLLQKGVREKVVSLLKFDSDSAGGIMHTDVLTLMEDYTVEKSVKILRRVVTTKDIYPTIFVTNRDYRLVGSIHLKDLVLHEPDKRIGSILRKNDLVINALEDQETVAKEMVHYGLMIVPVVDKEQHFLGVISSDTLVDVLVEEATEDVQKMAALAPSKQPYFEASFTKMLLERSYILIALLWIESFSAKIMSMHEATLNSFLLLFIPMLISVGGNTSNQTSAVVIQGMASGEIGFFNMVRFLRRELTMAAFLAGILGTAAFLRVYWSSGEVFQSIVVSGTAGIIVFTAVALGSIMPFMLKKLHVDPAFSAGPFLATLMDILGILIYCEIVKFFLF